MEIQRKRQKLLAKEEDRISDLPDHIIHHILSFLPSTKQVIQTGILSKQWRKQWIHVPVLIFDHSARMSFKKFLNFVDNTLILHDCSKIKKFHLEYPNRYEHDPRFLDKILFATRKHVQELYLHPTKRELLPEFLYNTASSLIKLTTFRCALMPNETVNWGSLTALHMHSCTLTDEALQHILSGTPLLEFLEVNNTNKFKELVIASKCLKRLVLRHHSGILKISCPKLVELSIIRIFLPHPNSFAQAIDNVLSTSPSLESFELKTMLCHEVDLLLIASKSLKRLILSSINNVRNIQVSCPQLQELELRGCYLRLRTLKLLCLPLSLCATLDFFQTENLTDTTSKHFVQDIMHQLQHVKVLIIGSLFIHYCLSVFKLEGRVPFVLYIKCLTLNLHSCDLIHHGCGIACVLRNAPVLEKLVINMPQKYYGNLNQFNDSGENFWNSNATTINCLLPQLKTIQIIDFPQRDDECNIMVNFIQFLLKNAIVLEKMVIILKGEQEDLLLRVSYQLLHLPRCSEHAIIELLYSK